MDRRQFFNRRGLRSYEENIPYQFNRLEERQPVQNNIPWELKQGAMTTRTPGRFEQNGLSYAYDDGSIYLGNHKVAAVPIIVEKEVLVPYREITNFEAMCSFMKDMRSGRKYGKLVELEDSQNG